MDTLLLCGGPLEEVFCLNVIEKLQPDVILLGLTGDWIFCYRNQIHPDYILGDFDSIDKEILDYYENQSEIPVKRYKPEKDATDTRIGLELAINLEAAGYFCLVQQEGDWTIIWGNLQSSLTAVRREGVEAWILDSRNALTVLDKPAVISRKEQFGTYISFFSMSDQVEGLTLTGFKYPLHEYTTDKFRWNWCKQ